MPIYTYECPACQRVEEHYMSTTEPSGSTAPDTACVACEHRGAWARVMSMPAPPRLAGQDGRARTQAKLKQRNADYRKTGRYKDERVNSLESARRRGL